MPFHAVIDVRRWNDFGIGTYIRNLVTALARLDRENRYTLIIRPQDQREIAALGPNFATAAYARQDTEIPHNVTCFPLFLRQLQSRSVSHSA